MKQADLPLKAGGLPADFFAAISAIHFKCSCAVKLRKAAGEEFISHRRNRGYTFQRQARTTYKKPPDCFFSSRAAHNF